MNNVVQCGGFEVKITSFSYHWGLRKDRATLNITGEIVKPEVKVVFEFKNQGSKHRLSFPKAMSYTPDLNLRELAVDTKNALLFFIASCEDVPFRYKKMLSDCVMVHHNQGNTK